mmetsp:Transcript_27331/g.65510  ORF Transcript_27331/g.65510 Transcript_27331/m.65510 type:complete len:83 (+) Transcript_27331:1334-1582(+)
MHGIMPRKDFTRDNISLLVIRVAMLNHNSMRESSEDLGPLVELLKMATTSCVLSLREISTEALVKISSLQRHLQHQYSLSAD